MTKLFVPKVLAIIISILCFSFAQGQTFKLLKDINTLTHSSPTNATNASNEYAVLNGKAYFNADDGIHGQELWCTDGTAAGTKLVKDINPGAGGSHVSNIYPFNNKIYFFSSNDGITSKLYTSDGTAAGTVILKDSMGVSGYESFEKPQFAALNNILIFTVSNEFDNEEIWRTDGTTAGTKQLINFNTPEYNYGHEIDRFTVFNGNMYFTVNHFDPILWYTNGTKAGTQRFKGPVDFSNAGTLTVAGNTMYINLGGELWKTNGDSASTQKLSHAFHNAINDIRVFKNEVYCSVISSNTGAYGIYKYNAAASDGLKLYKNSATNNVVFAPAINDSLLFFTTASSPTVKPGLWVTNGTDTVKLLDDDAAFASFYSARGKLYFSHTNNTAGEELWVSDGSVTGTKKLDNVDNELSNPWPSNFTLLGNKVLFTANTTANGYELWQTEGAKSNTLLLKDINTVATASSSLIFTFDLEDTINNKLVFWANDGIHGIEQWATDGTNNGTILLKDIYPGPRSGNGSGFYNFQGYLIGPYLPINNRLNNYDYFFGQSNPNVYALYKTQGTPATTSFATDFGPLTTGLTPLGVTINSDKKKLFALITTPDRIGGLYAYNGSAQPSLLKDKFRTAFARIREGYILSAGDNTYFFVDPGNSDDGFELWKTDGTVAGTKIVAPLYKGRYAAYINYMINYKNKLFFMGSSGYLHTGTDPNYEPGTQYLWQSDGTASGTTRVKKVALSEQPLVISNNKLYFIASDDTNGEELWVTDGTEAATHMVKNIAPGTAGSGISSQVDFKGSLYFIANNGTTQGIWKTNGTDTGTVFITKASSSLVKGDDKLYFILNNKIWQSDGTSAGTKQMDTSSLTGITPYNLLYAYNRLYFIATNYTYGTELYTTSEKLLPVTLLNFTGALKGNDALLQWQTANELHNDYFNVQRSTTGGGFTTIGRVQAKTGTDNNYNFTDAGVTALGVNKLYYRLQQVDEDGKNAYSKTIQLDVIKGALLKVWPNPATSFATITSSVNMPGAVIQLVDANGHTVYTNRHSIPAGGSVTIPLKGYARGVYTVTVQQQGMQKQEYKVVVE